MGELQFKIVTQEVETIDFDCGVESINEYVKESYYQTIIQHAYAYSIESNGIILGYYQVLFRNICLDDFPEDTVISGYRDDESMISSLYIRYIAIDKKYQHKKVGTSTLRTIIKRVQELSRMWPVRVIAIDAIDSLVPWYKKEGFMDMEKNTTGQDGVTTAMFYDCFRFSEELEYYENMY